MAVTLGTAISVDTVVANYMGDAKGVQIARILFYHDSTTNYDTATHGKITGVAALISASRRNGRTITLVGGAMLAQHATKASDQSVLGLASVAVSTADITYNVTTSDFSTEVTNGAPCPAQDQPFGILVGFYET
jgi:hypothetical protein